MWYPHKNWLIKSFIKKKKTKILRKMFFTGSLSIDLFAIITAGIIILLTKHIWVLGYWKRKGVLGPKPSLIMGTLQNVFKGKQTIGEVFKDQYLEYKNKGHRYFGSYFFGSPNFVPIDLDLIKAVLQTDFPHFHSHGMYHNEDADPLSANLFNLDGTKWKDIRAKLTPCFTSGKLKIMHSILTSNGNLFKEVLSDSTDNGAVNIKDLLNRFTTDNIGSCAFGLDVKCLKNPDAEFIKVGAKVFEPGLENMAKILPPLVIPHRILKLLKFTTVSRYIIDFFYGTVVDTIKYRKENNIIRNDFMNMMIEMMDSDDPKRKLTINEIASQSFIFFLAGFETSATTATFACYELAANQDVQEKLREDINKVLSQYNGELSYETVNDMEYLDRVVQETLRKHAPVEILIRKCTKDYKVPDSPFIINEGTLLTIPVTGIHYDEQYYSKPEKFDPERFTKENKKKIPQFAFLPFGEGPRICIGARFGLHQTKVALISLIKNFRISLNKKTITPLVYSKAGIVASVEGGVWLNLEKISSGSLDH